MCRWMAHRYNTQKNHTHTQNSHHHPSKFPVFCWAALGASSGCMHVAHTYGLSDSYKNPTDMKTDIIVIFNVKAKKRVLFGCLFSSKWMSIFKILHWQLRQKPSLAWKGRAGPTYAHGYQYKPGAIHKQREFWREAGQHATEGAPSWGSSLRNVSPAVLPVHCDGSKRLLWSILRAACPWQIQLFPWFRIGSSSWHGLL